MSRVVLRALVASAALATLLQAQPGVRLGLIYGEGGARPGIFVLPVAGAAGDSLRTIVMRDLDFGDRVTVLPKATALRAPAAGGALDYVAAGRLGINGVIQLSLISGGVSVVLHDVAGRQVLQRRTVTLPGAPYSAAWRMAAHGVSDQCEEWISGERGIAASRVAYVADGRIHLIDSDGANAVPLTQVGARTLSPSFHPSGQSIVYAALEPAGSAIYVTDLRGASRRVVPPSGLNISPTFTPAGTAIAYAHGDDFGTEIYLVGAGGGVPRRISIGRGSDNTSPSYSPDGRRIAFTSGRSGRPDVYIADDDGTNADLLAALSSSQGYRSSPDWSPDGRAIVFQSQIGGRFQVMMISLRDRTVKQLTADASNEDPAWAADARHVVVSSTRSGVRQLWVLDTETGRARQLTAGGGARLAAWSPRLIR
ncbi:MAG: PD40 domain-containing protein [Gemmatimonadaceae bacterium]|nr:PD40 domain-containing protein [Gemmatimonadaceae bacterium]